MPELSQVRAQHLHHPQNEGSQLELKLVPFIGQGGIWRDPQACLGGALQNAA
jgi:N-acetyl-beta-hexosaminidase